MNKLPEYTAAIRTLGKAGTKYMTLLTSLINQTHAPKEIHVYIPHGYSCPDETVGKEKIFYVKKGMVAQRALAYDDIKTEWILFLDDDMSIEPDGVEKILSDTLKANADVCAIDGFPHDKFRISQKISMFLLMSAIPRFGNKDKGYTLSVIGTDIYNPYPQRAYAWSTTNSGNAFICRKKDFLSIHFEEDLWLDDAPYAIPEDKVMYYKMHLNGLKILTHYDSGFTHLDAGTSMANNRARQTAYSSARNNKIFRELYLKPNLSLSQKIFASFLNVTRIPIIWLYNAYLKSSGKYYGDEISQGIKDAKAFLKRRNEN